MKEVILANCAALSYADFSKIRRGTQLTDLAKTFKNQINTVADNFVFMNYTEDFKNLWGNSLLNDITFSEQLVDDMNGFSVTVFESHTYMIIAFRGTDDFMDAFNDIQIALNRVSSQLGSAYKFARDMITIGNPFKKRIYLTGHSLGGALVQSIMSTNLASKIESATTFNGLGMKESVKDWNVGKVSKTDIMASFAWSGVINPSIVAESLLDLYNSVRERNSNSLLGKTVTDSEIRSILTRGMAQYSQNNGFTSVFKKEFDKFKIELGTTTSDRDIRNGVSFDKPLVTDNVINGEVNDRHIEVIKSIMDFILDVNITNDSLSKTKNYVISQDIVASLRSHIGNKIVVDDGELVDVSKMGTLSLIKNKMIAEVHSMGNFLLFLNDQGMFDGKFRHSFVLNVVRDFIKSNPKYVELLGSDNPTSIRKNLADLILGAPVAILADKAFISKLTFEWILKKVLPYIILEVKEDTEGKYFNIGIITNLNHKDTDGSLDPRIIKIRI